MNRDNQPNQTERQLPTNLLAWLAIIAITGGIFALLYSVRGNSRPTATRSDPVMVAVGLPKLAAAVAAGEVKELVVQDNLLIATKKDNSKLTARKEANISALETLRVLGVPAKTLTDLPVVIEAEQEESTGFSPLSFLSVILVIALLGLFVFRSWRPARSSNSLFNSGHMGRSNPRIFSGGSDKNGQDAASKNLPPPVKFRHVAGVEQAKLELQEVVEFLKEPSKFVRLGARVPRGVLMAGPPGTGKTLLAKAVAGEAMVPFFSISGSEFVEMFVGVGAARVRDLFKRAREQAPAVIFVDEIDAVGRRRGANFGSGNDEREQTLNQILVEMDGFPTDINVIVMASTNRPDILDPALLRPGRFDRKVILDQPDVHAREAILEIHTQSKPLAADISLADLARLTPGFVGADLENMVNEAAILAARRNLNVITRLEFQDAMERIIAGPERQGKILSDHEREVVAYHEAGHALVMHHLDQCDPVHKISIVSRGMALGYTMPLLSDKYLRSRQAFEDEITGLLGGRAAEEIIFQQITTGAANDLERATKLARAMVTRFGFSEKLGLRTFGEDQGNSYLGPWGELRDYSEEMAQWIDQEIYHILERAYGRAKTIVTEQQGKLVGLALALLERETVERLEFESLMA